jgi:virginiamycin B lyase
VIRGVKRKRKRSKYQLLAAAIFVAIVISIAFVYFSLLDRPPASYQTRVTALNLQSTPQRSKYVTEYPIHQNSQPNAIALDSLGNAWFTLGANNSIAVLTPSNGTVREFKVPDSNSSMISWGMTVDKKKGMVWFTDLNSNAVWSFEMSRMMFTKYPLPNAGSGPYQLAQDQAGNIWFTELYGGRIGEIDMQGLLKEYVIPTRLIFGSKGGSVGPAGITVSGAGTVWFAEAYVGAVGSVSNGSFHQYPLKAASSPVGIALDPRGHVWITQHGASYISELDPTTNATTTFSTSTLGVTTSLPYFIQADTKNNIWFNEHLGNAIARFSPTNHTLTEFEVPTRTGPGNISGVLTMALDTEGHPWFTELYSGKIGTLGRAVDVRPKLLSVSDELQIPAGSSAILRLTIQDAGAGSSYLTYSVTVKGNLFNFSFSPLLGQGYYTSTALIRNNGNANKGTYYVTISAVSRELVASVIVAIKT